MNNYTGAVKENHCTFYWDHSRFSPSFYFEWL